MITGLSTNFSQLTIVKNGITERYSFSDIKSVAPYNAYSGDQWVVINFINESRNSSLKIKFSEVDPLLGFASAEAICSAISTAMESFPSTVDTIITPTSRTSYIRRSTSTGSITGAYSFSIANVGGADGDFEGDTLKSGEVINFDAGAIGNVLNDVNYDATGTEFLIVYVAN